MSKHLLTVKPITNPVSVKAIMGWYEKPFQAEVVDAAEKLGWKVYHTYDSRRSAPGFPDLVLVHPRRKVILYRELKREGQYPDKNQREWLEALDAAGQDTGVWRPRDWVSGEIQRTLAGLDE